MAEAIGGIDYAKIREEIQRDREFEEEQIITDLAIRDVAPHASSIADCARSSVVTIVVESSLDQTVSVQPNGSRRIPVWYAPMGAAFDVPAHDQRFVTLTPDTRGWMPFVFVIVTAAAAPTSGVLNVYALKRR